MKLAIMQPYTFPYIGYFQLINAVDKFIVYDDVNFVKKGYINRNRILVNNQPHLFSIPCKSISQNKAINQIALNFDDKARTGFLKTLQMSYKKAPFFNDFYPTIEQFIRDSKSQTISEFATESIALICNYLSIKTRFELSSKSHSDSLGLEKEQRLINICKKENATTYINAIGGLELYKKTNFKKEGIAIYFFRKSTYQIPAIQCRFC